MDLVLFVWLGVVLGALAHLLVPARQPGGWLSACCAGGFGAALGGLVARLTAWYRGEVPSSGWLLVVLTAAAFAGTERVLARRQSLR